MVSEAAELGEGVAVGPYAIVEAGAVIGDGTTIMAHAVISGHATLGRDCAVHYGAIVGHEPQDLAFRGGTGRLRVGDRTVIREQATLHRATREDRDTVVGDDCYLMGQCHVAHDCQIGDHVIICNSCLIAGHVEVADRAFLSGNSVIHQFSRVGRVVMLSGSSAIGKDVGPFLTVAGRSDVLGFNTVGMRRASLTTDARRRVKDAYHELFAAPSLELGLERVASIGEQPEIASILAFYRQSRRGFSRPPPGHKLRDVTEA